MHGNFSVTVEPFAERHYIKSFEKKYKQYWDITLQAILAELARIDALLLTDKAETISDVNGIKIVKTKFKIAGSKDSAKSSGNRCIVAWHEDSQVVKILLVYGKTDLGSGKETSAWKQIIKDTYPDYRNLL
jgi:hypothetical protein